MATPLAERLLSWYALHRRDLPWRRLRDPYAVWVSEVMLQQTRVETAAAYFERWMRQFPTLQSLAAAPLQEVLKAWEGLGYYSRARNLQRAARIVMVEHAGRLPEEVPALRKLPGIGRYTAGAIASIAFGKDCAALDGNIRRVLSRVFDVAEEVRSPAGERRLWELAEQQLPPGKASEYNQALMDLGAGICLPRLPRCESCPLADLCQAYSLGIQEQRPVRRSPPRPPHHLVTAAVVRKQGAVLITQRPAEGLLGGMWEFPGGKMQPGEDLAGCLKRELREELGIDVQVGASLGVYRHAYTHFRVTLHAFSCELLDGATPQALQVQEIRWVKPAELGAYPMGKIDRQIAERLSHAKGG